MAYLVTEPQLPALVIRAHLVRITRGQGQLEDFLDRRDEVDLQLLAHVVGDVLLDRLLVPLGQDDFLDAHPVRGQDLFLDAADGEHPARERDLARHGHSRPHRTAGELRNQRGHEGHARGRAVLGDGALGDVEVQVHALEERLLDAEGTGGRVLQAKDGTLLVETTVPAGLGILSSEWMQPQQFDSLMGKVLRINTDGTIPKDNPFVATPGKRPEIYALGFRDPQGMAIHPKTGRLWTSEHGPRGGDEINEVQKGKNYGFPVIGYGRDYNGKPINGDKTVQAGLEQPVYYWTPDIAPAGIAFYTGRMFPAWNGNLFVSSLLGRYLVRLVLDGRHVVAEERLLADLKARIRGVHEGPDGSLYVLTDGANGKILRLVRKS